MLSVIQKKVFNLLRFKHLIFSMKEDSKDYKYCINVAISNAKKRINLLDKMNKKCILEEYKEWIKDELDYQSVLLLREDPII
tara:strand:+ start:808 stop:1053 length:246 start_codon:yes stop_codon:yes gene_type:complete